MATSKQVVHRSSKSGEFVKESFANSHPSTTERQVIKHTPAPPPPVPKKGR